MKTNHVKSLKKLSLASAVGVFAFTYVGTAEANNDVVDELQLENEVVETVEEAEVIEDSPVVVENEAAEVIEDSPVVVENEAAVIEEPKVIEDAPVVVGNEAAVVEEPEVIEEAPAEAEESVPLVEEEIEAPQVLEEEAVSENQSVIEESQVNSEEYIEPVQELSEEAVMPINEAIVVNAIDPIDEDDTTENVTNNISLIDYDNGTILENITFNGWVFDYRLQEHINNINTNNNTEYEIINQTLVNSSQSSISLPGFSSTSYSNDYDVFIRNNNSNTISPVRPFLPEGTIYDDVNTGRVLREISVINLLNNSELYYTRAVAYETADTSIRYAMENLNEEIYYYDSVDASTGWTSIVTNGQSYSGPSQTLTIYVNEIESYEYYVSEDITPYETEIVYDVNLPEGEELIETVGQDGIDSVEYRDLYRYGVLEETQEFGRENTQNLVNQVIVRGTGVIDEIITIDIAELAYGIEYVEDPSLAEGEEVIEQEGINGQVEYTTVQPTLNGEVYGEPTEISNVLLEPINEIIRIGVTSTETPVYPTPEEPETENPVVPSPEEPVAEDPVVSTPEEPVTENPVISTPENLVTDESVDQTPEELEVITEEEDITEEIVEANDINTPVDMNTELTLDSSAGEVVESSTEATNQTVESHNTVAKADEVSKDTAVAKASENEERLPETGEAQSNVGFMAAVAAFFGGLVLLVKGRRKESK